MPDIRDQHLAVDQLPASQNRDFPWAVPMPTLAGMSDEIDPKVAEQLYDELLRDIDPKIAEQLKSRANDVSQRYQEYLRTYQAKHPEMTNENVIFQAWAIMYLAHLQFSMDGLNTAICNLHTEIRILQGYTQRKM